MSPLPLFARASLATAVIAGAALLIAARPLPVIPAAATGATFKYRITSTSSDKNTREQRAMFANVRMQDGNIRMDYVEGRTPMGQQNGYVIVQGETGRFIVVNPQDKAAFIMTADAFGSGMGALMNNPMLKMTISNTSFRFRDLGAGEPLLGYRTRKVRTWYNSTMEIKATMLPDQRIVTSDSSDQWIATGVELGQANMEQWAKSFAAGVKTTNPEVGAELTKYTNEYGRTGMVLKSVTWSTQTDKKGKVTTDVATMEVTDLTLGVIDRAVFEIPKGYEVTDMSKMMADVRSAMDSARASGAEDEKKQEKPGAKDAIKAGLGGMLRKKPPAP
jgi:hypothetical protein